MVAAPRSRTRATAAARAASTARGSSAAGSGGAGPVRGKGKARAREDEQAAELLLTFSRLVRGHRHHDKMPRHLQALLTSGVLAPRHIGAFAVVALVGPVTVSDLAQREGLALSTASLLVTQLSQVGLVERREDERDRRRTVVSVAPAHRRESEVVLESTLAPLRRALVRMGAERAGALLEGLAILVEEVTGSAGPEGCAPGAHADPPGDVTETAKEVPA